MTRRNLILFILLYGIWLLWSGHYTPLLLCFGAASCAAVVWMARRAGALDREGAPIHITWKFIAYLPWLAREVVLSAIDVSRCVLRGNHTLRCRWIIVEGSQQSDLAFAIYANSITLTPGTTTVDLQGRGLLVHALTDSGVDGLRSGEMNRRVTLLEEVN